MPHKKPRTTIYPPKYKKDRNIPALICAVIIGLIGLFIPIVLGRTLLESSEAIINNPSLIASTLFFSVLLIALYIAIFFTFLLSGLGKVKFRYSKHAGILCTLYLFVLILIHMPAQQNVSEITILSYNIPYWMGTLAVPITGILYLLFYHSFDRNRKNTWKNITFIVIVVISISIIGITIPSVSAPLSLSQPQITNTGTKYNGIYSVGSIATDHSGNTGLAIVSNDGTSSYQVVAVALDQSKKGWHTNGPQKLQWMNYNSVEQQYPVKWSGGMMDISHIPTKDWSLSENPNSGQGSGRFPQPTPAPTSQGTSYPTSSQVFVTKSFETNAGSIEQSILKYVNQERANRGLPALTWNDKAALVARTHTQLMISTRRFTFQDSHQLPGELTPWQRLTDIGIQWTGAGETIAFGVNGNDSDSIAKSIVQGWVWEDGPEWGHRHIILDGITSDPGYNSVGVENYGLNQAGVGVVYGTLNVDGNPYTGWQTTMDFVGI